MIGSNLLKKKSGRWLLLIVFLTGAAGVTVSKVSADAPGPACPPKTDVCPLVCGPEQVCIWQGIRTSTGSCVYKPQCVF